MKKAISRIEKQQPRAWKPSKREEVSTFSIGHNSLSTLSTNTWSSKLRRRMLFLFSQIFSTHSLKWWLLKLIPFNLL